MGVRAKFKVTAIRRTQTAKKVPFSANGMDEYEPCEMQTIELSPVYGNKDPNHENTKFWEASPSGKIELGCINLEAASCFELGGEYYIDFTAAKPATEA